MFKLKTPNNNNNDKKKSTKNIAKNRASYSSLLTNRMQNKK